MKNATAAQALPTMATALHPKWFARAPTIGPAIKHNHVHVMIYLCRCQ